MTDQDNQALDGYGFRLGAELHALSDRAIQPFHAAGIARAVAAERPRRIHLLPVGSWWLGRGRGPMLAIIVLASTLLALWASVGQRPTLPATFAPGSIAFAREGHLYVAASDGSRPVRVADGYQPNGDGIRHFAFSPDRRYLAFGKHNDPIVPSAETLDILSADGTTTGIYTWGGHPLGTPGPGGLFFAWAPDSSRLAVYPGATDGEIAIVGIDGDPMGVLRPPSGASVTTMHEQFFAVLSWSPDSTWLATAVKSGGDVSPCAGADDPFETCYILLATDGSGARGLFDDSSGYFAWAPDSRAATTHWAPSAIEIRPPDGSAPQVISLPTSVNPGDGHVLAWSADGTRLAVATGSETPPEDTLLVIDGDGTLHPVPIDDQFSGNGSNVQDLAWSMDGQRLLFGGIPRDGRSGIWSIDVGGGSSALVVDSVDSSFDVADGRP